MKKHIGCNLCLASRTQEAIFMTTQFLALAEKVYRKILYK